MTPYPRTRQRPDSAPQDADSKRLLTKAFEAHCVRLGRTKGEQLRRLMLAWVRDQQEHERRRRQAGGEP